MKELTRQSSVGGNFFVPTVVDVTPEYCTIVWGIR